MYNVNLIMYVYICWFIRAMTERASPQIYTPKASGPPSSLLATPTSILKPNVCKMSENIDSTPTVFTGNRRIR